MSGFKVSRALTPYKFLWVLLGLYCLLSFFQRILYLAWIGFENRSLVPHFYFSFIKGLAFDLISGTFLFLLVAALLTLLPKRWLAAKYGRRALAAAASLLLLIAFFMAVTEGFFFNEFHSRFNFIAVDYLVYSHEVIENAVESYPLAALFAGLFIFWAPFAYGLNTLVWRVDFSAFTVKSRAAVALTFFVIPSFVFVLTENVLIANDEFWSRELSKNTIFTLFSAYNHNSIDFNTFYSTLDPSVARQMTHQWLNENVASEGKDDSVVRNISPLTKPKSWNVILVIIESLSARYLQHYGNPHQLTPNLDRLADEGLFFSQIYATGTRTVRGLEALILGLPPTPGQSILRRPNSDHLFNLGAVLNENGYKSQFIYGGHAYFDNMKDWFESNGFEVVDRPQFASDEIHFSNAWGVCDEDLFDQVLKQADRLQTLGSPFFQAVLTTSNHRPYTYPPDRIDIPSRSGRNGAVKYTDYAIGRFVKMAESKPWFKNTLFVFVADHNASVAGGSDIPINDYLIPMIFYNPNLINRQEVKKLGSQIDFAPTLLGRLGVTYQSRFFGQDLDQAQANRAMMGTYQKVALFEPGHLTILSPGHWIESQTLNNAGAIEKSELIQAHVAANQSPRIQQTVAIYQTASELFTSGKYKMTYRFDLDPTDRKSKLIKFHSTQ